MANPTILAGDSPITDLARRLKRTRALRGIEVLPGAPQMAMQTAPGRIILWPSDGTFADPGDKSVSIIDIEQQVIVECWGKGSSSGAADEATYASWNATWRLLVLFIQALAEQGENPTDPTDPGLFWQMAAGPRWNPDRDTTQQGTSVQILLAARLAVPAASDDTGHVGDNWTHGEAEDVAVDAPPYAPAP